MKRILLTSKVIQFLTIFSVFLNNLSLQRENFEGIIYKFDFSKAFDKPDINFLLKLLEVEGSYLCGFIGQAWFFSPKVAMLVNSDIGD